MALTRTERTALSFMLRHLVAGIFGACVFGGSLLALDVGGIRSMAFHNEDGLLTLVLLFFGLCVTFGGVAMGVGVMSLGEDSH